MNKKNSFYIYILFWIIIQLINIHIINDMNYKNIKQAQSISSLINSLILVIFYLINNKKNNNHNIIFFSAFYIVDLIYYIIYFITDLDLINNKDNELIKNFRYIYILHHFIALILLYSANYHINYIIIYKYTNIFIILLEIPTIFINFSNILKFSKLYKLKKISDIFNSILFIVCRSIIYNLVLYKFITKEIKLIKSKKKINKKILNISIINLIILGICNIIYGIKKLYDIKKIL